MMKKKLISGTNLMKSSRGLETNQKDIHPFGLILTGTSIFDSAKSFDQDLETSFRLL
jgi:hypothetical protein